MGKQRVCWLLVGVIRPADDLKRYGFDVTQEYELDEPDQSIAVVRANERTTLEISAGFALYCIEVLLKVPERSSLPNRRLVVDRHYSPDEVVVEACRLDNHAEPRGFLDSASDVRGDTLGEPVLKC